MWCPFLYRFLQLEPFQSLIMDNGACKIGYKKGKSCMEKLIYWIRKTFKGKEKHCKHFCVCCEFYDICKEESE